MKDLKGTQKNNMETTTHNEKSSVRAKAMRHMGEEKEVIIINGCTVSFSSTATPESTKRTLEYIKEILLSPYRSK